LIEISIRILYTVTGQRNTWTSLIQCFNGKLTHVARFVFPGSNCYHWFLTGLAPEIEAMTPFHQTVVRLISFNTR